MIGTLGITPQGWKVSFEYWFIAPNGGVCDRSQLKECLYIRELPLHPDDNPDYEFGRDVVGEQIEFEMVWYKDVKYAKLINVDKLGNEDVPKLGYDERKQNLIDIMNDDAKDGLYDVREVVEDDVEKLQQDAWDNYEHEEGNLYSTTFRNAFKLGYNKAKSTLYTEEQVREVGMMKQKLEQLILLLESRSQQLENEATSKTDIEGLTTEQTRDVKIKKIGESQGINLCVLAIKKIIT